MVQLSVDAVCGKEYLLTTLLPSIYNDVKIIMSLLFKCADAVEEKPLRPIHR